MNGYHCSLDIKRESESRNHCTVYSVHLNFHIGWNLNYLFHWGAMYIENMINIRGVSVNR